MKMNNEKSELVAAARITAPETPEFWQEVARKLEEDRQAKQDLVKPRNRVKNGES